MLRTSSAEVPKSRNGLQPSANYCPRQGPNLSGGGRLGGGSQFKVTGGKAEPFLVLSNKLRDVKSLYN